MIMAKAFPKSRVHGFDFHEKSIEEARQHAKEHKVRNIDFQTREAKDLPGRYDLITMFDCLHDMGDPVGAMKHIRAALKPNGSVMIVEPMAGDSLKDNSESHWADVLLRVNDGLCSQFAGPTHRRGARGAGGRKKLRKLIMEEAGFSVCRRATETPFNLILEARP